MTQAYTREAVEALLPAALPVQARTLAMGFTANVDVLLAGGPALTAQMQRWCAAGTAPEAAVWRAVLEAQVECAVEGRGGELVLEPAAVLRQFDAYGQAVTLGGTGVRAAAQAAQLGQRSIVSVPIEDPRLGSLLPSSLVAVVPTRTSSGDARLATHYVIEMPEAPRDQGPSCAHVPVRRPSRLIIHGDEVLLPLLPGSFIQHVVQSNPPVEMLLLSGFNTYTRMPVLEGALADAARWMQEVRHRVPHTWIYLELAGFASPCALRRVLEALGPQVDVVGMNEDEWAVARDPFCARDTMTPSAEIAMLRETLAGYELARLVVHTAWVSSYVGRTPLDAGERATAARALVLGNTAAGFRFARGRDGGWRELRGATHAWGLSYAGVACAVAAEGYADMVVIPAWDVPDGVGTIGLGDTFTGAFLTGLDPSARAGP